MTNTKEKFAIDFPNFKNKIQNFIATNDFTSKTQNYNDIFSQMASVSPADMKEYINKAPEFLKARNTSLELMERIVSLHTGLEKLFTLNEEDLAQECHYDLSSLDNRIAKDLKTAANLLNQFNEISEKGREIINKCDDPFLSQAI